MVIYVFDRVENIVGKGENTGFLLYPQCFQKPSCPWLFYPFPNKPWFSRVYSESL